MTPTDPRHGSYAGYHQHLRENGTACDACRDAAARYERGRQLDILNQRPRLVRTTGPRRKVRALVALGHPFGRIARHAGMASENLRKFTYGDTEVMTTRRADVINRTYDALSMRLPDERDGHARRRVLEARTIAHQHGWAPPLAWEGLDIDDPTAQPYTATQAAPEPDDVDPVVVERILAGDLTLARTATKAERIQVVAAWSETTGRSLNDLARATGWKTERYTTHHRKEHAA